MNVRGLGNMQKRWQVFEWLKNLNSSVYLLQETHAISQVEKKWKEEWKGEIYISGNKSNGQGVGILLNPKSILSITKCHELAVGRLIACEIEINGKPFIIVNIYGTNIDDDKLFLKLQQFLSLHNDKSIIVGGDFNTVLQTHIDKKHGRNDTNSKCRITLNSLTEICDLCDIWRVKHPTKKQYTLFSNSNPPISCRLDYFLISNSICNIVKQCNINLGYKTDHNIVNLVLNSNNNTKGTGYFKMNNSISLDQQYQSAIKRAIKDITDINVNSNPNTMWEILKGEIRNQTIRYTTHKRKEENKQEQSLIEEITKIQENISDNSEYGNDYLQRVQHLKMELENIRDIKIKGQMLRSKAQHIEENEKNTKYFANIEKQRAESKTIHTLKVNETEITGIKNILKAETDFFKSIYEKENIIDEHILSDFFNVNSKQLNEEEKLPIEGKLTEGECLSALKEMQNNKIPGSDGISVVL